jgi:hypothetical protein
MSDNTYSAPARCSESRRLVGGLVKPFRSTATALKSRIRPLRPKSKSCSGLLRGEARLEQGGFSVGRRKGRSFRCWLREQDEIERQRWLKAHKEKRERGERGTYHCKDEDVAAALIANPEVTDAELMERFDCTKLDIATRRRKARQRRSNPF